MKTTEQIQFIINTRSELENIGISMLLWDSNMNEVSPDLATDYTAYIIDDNDFMCGMYRGTIPLKKPFTKELVLERIEKYEKRQFIDYAKIFESIRTPELKFATAQYGLSVWALFKSKYEFEKDLQSLRDLLNKHSIEFTECYSDARWVWQFRISKKKENIAKLLTISHILTL